MATNLKKMNLPVDFWFEMSELSTIEEELLEPVRTKKDRDSRRSYGRDTYHAVDGIFPWTRCSMIYEIYHGKSFNEAFAYYCKIVPVYQQHFFMENIDNSEEVNMRWRSNPYYVDDNGIIQKRKRTAERKKAIIYSPDYKVELRHKVTGKKKPEHRWSYEYPFTSGTWKHKYPKAKNYYDAQNLWEAEFIPVVVSGWSKECESVKDPEYQRYLAELRKAQKMNAKAQKKMVAEKAYNLTHETPEMREQRIAKNLIKISKHGFDDNTSFHKEKES